MRPACSLAALAGAAALAGWGGEAQAYRPFDGTDAAVADVGQVEIEFAPAEFLREDSERTLLAPHAVVNYGFSPGWEAVAEGAVAHGLSAGSGGTSLSGVSLSLKRVLRDGVLQQDTGPSVATEFGLLLPGIGADPGTGARLAGVVSQRWDWGTVHLNAVATMTRQQHADVFVGAILEGPHDWPVRPVAEVFYQRDLPDVQTRSLLVGAIWQMADDFAVDVALRGARVDDHLAGELRAGVTFAFAVH